MSSLAAGLRAQLSRLSGPVHVPRTPQTITMFGPPTLPTGTSLRTFTTSPVQAASKAGKGGKGGPPVKLNASQAARLAERTRLQMKASRTKKKGKGRREEMDPKIVNMKKHFGLLNPRVIPPPLRMGRNRHLRHWTIHRAWLLFLRQQREARERSRMRLYQSMYRACEELRLTEGPGTRDQGYLYRVAMEKKGIYGHGGIPIEYARAQTETPGHTPWNHDWKP